MLITRRSHLSGEYYEYFSGEYYVKLKRKLFQIIPLVSFVKLSTPHFGKVDILTSPELVNGKTFHCVPFFLLKHHLNQHLYLLWFLKKENHWSEIIKSFKITTDLGTPSEK